VQSGSHGTASSHHQTILPDKQQAKHGQELLLAFTHLRELDARAIPALSYSRISGGDGQRRCETTKRFLQLLLQVSSFWML
jgi:hypothetical protein